MVGYHVTPAVNLSTRGRTPPAGRSRRRLAAGPGAWADVRRCDRGRGRRVAGSGGRPRNSSTWRRGSADLCGAARSRRVPAPLADGRRRLAAPITSGRARAGTARWRRQHPGDGTGTRAFIDDGTGGRSYRPAGV